MEQVKLIIFNSLDVIARCIIFYSLDVLAHTKIDDTFPTNQFVIKDYMRPLRYDWNKF